MSEALKDRLAQVWSANKTIHFYDFSGPTESVTFQAFGLEVKKLAQNLTALGVGPGVVVAVMGPTGRPLLESCAAVWSCGATLTVLPTPTRLGNLENFLAQTIGKIERSRASLLLGESDLVSGFAPMLGLPAFDWEELKVSCPDAEFSVSKLEAQPALVQFSSGTTREPQPILLSAEALLHNAEAVLNCFPGGANRHSCVTWLPLYHDMGLIGCFLMPLLAPGDLTVMGPEVFAVRPLTWLEAISNGRATTSSAPNFALSHCCDRITDAELEKLDLSCWEIAMVGAETVRPRTLRRFAKKFAPTGFNAKAFSPVYGLAEATLAVTFSPLSQGLKTLKVDSQVLAETGQVVVGDYETASLGQPLSGVELEVREADSVLGDRQLGEVWVKSPALMSGTLEEGEFRPQTSPWHNTGDAGFTVDGDLFLYGRRKDILLLDGRNHDPGMVEQAAESLAALRRCCAFVSEDSESEKDRLVLLCEVGGSWQGDLGELSEQIESQCVQDCRLQIDEIVLLKSGTLPVTSSGKLRRSEAAQNFHDNSLQLR